MRPQWLATDGGIAPSPGCKPRSGKKGFLDKTLAEITSFFKDGFFSEKYADRNGLMQKLDPRVKVVTITLLVIAVSFLTHLLLITGLHLFVLVLVSLSMIPLGFFLPRVWLFIPLFSGIMAIPALFNVFVPGDPLLTLIRFDAEWSIGPFKVPETIAITRQGLTTATLFVMRVATSVSLVILVVLTTKWPHLLKALRALGIPQMFTFIIGMTYRYIHLLLRLIEDIHLARKSRFIKKGSIGSGQKWVASQMGIVLKRSLNVSEDVYSAMLSRGFSNEVKILDTFRLGKADYLWICFVLLIISLVIGLNKIMG